MGLAAARHFATCDELIGTAMVPRTDGAVQTTIH